VLSVDRGRYTLLIDDGGPHEHVLLGKRARELRDQAIVTGDVVDVVGDTSGDEGTLGRIVRIRPRETVLRRSADDTDTVERVIVANADQLLIVIATANPEPRPRLVDRYLVAAYDAGISPLLVMTKTDLADPAPFSRQLRGARLPSVPQLSRPLADRGTRARVGRAPHGRGRALRKSANRRWSTRSCREPTERSGSSTW
jgi:ribosome biogenesis GTPase